MAKQNIFEILREKVACHNVSWHSIYGIYALRCDASNANQFNLQIPYILGSINIIVSNLFVKTCTRYKKNFTAVKKAQLREPYDLFQFA